MKNRQNERSLRTFKCQAKGCGCAFKTNKFTVEDPAQSRKSATSQCPMCGAWAHPDYSKVKKIPKKFDDPAKEG